MRKKVQVHMLPTDSDNPTVVPFLQMNQSGRLVKHTAGGEFRKYTSLGFKPQHLYFTSDEEIKDHDHYIDSWDDTPVIRKRSPNHIGWFQNAKRKIVASTDPRLKDKAGYYDNPSIPDIPLDFVKRYVEEQGNIKEIELEMEEEPKLGWTDQLKLHSDDTVIIHPIEDVVTKSLKALDEFIKEHPEEAVRIGKEVKAMGFEGPTVSEYFDMTAISDILDYMCKGRYHETNPVLYQYVADFLMSDKRNKLEKMYTREEVQNACFVAFNRKINLPFDTVSWDEWKREWFDKNI